MKRALLPFRQDSTTETDGKLREQIAIGAGAQLDHLCGVCRARDGFPRILFVSYTNGIVVNFHSCKMRMAFGWSWMWRPLAHW
jgi:hypothetical protein